MCDDDRSRFRFSGLQILVYSPFSSREGVVGSKNENYTNSSGS